MGSYFCSKLWQFVFNIIVTLLRIENPPMFHGFHKVRYLQWRTLPIHLSMTRQHILLPYRSSPLCCHTYRADPKHWQGNCRLLPISKERNLQPHPDRSGPQQNSPGCYSVCGLSVWRSASRRGRHITIPHRSAIGIHSPQAVSLPPGTVAQASGKIPSPRRG